MFCQRFHLKTGNYNKDKFDDLIGRDGRKYFDARDFAETWQIGHDRSCAQPLLTSSSSSGNACATAPERRDARKKCDILRGVSTCEVHVPLDAYYE